MPVVSDYTALLSGSSHNGTTGTGAFISFSFPTSVPAYLTNSYSAAGLATFRPYTAAEQTAARNALNAWAAVSGITFLEVAPGEGDLKFMVFDLDLMNNPTAAGFAYYPGNGYEGLINSDIFMDSPYAANMHVLLHEIGHALGLKHSFEGPNSLDPALDNFGRTVMSYTSGGFAGDVLGDLDIAAIRAIYGDQTRDGTQVASHNWNATTRVLTQTGDAAANSIFGIGGSDVIYGMGGNDTIKGREGVNQLYGGDGDDDLSSTTGANGSLLDGGAGNDTLRGGNSTMTLHGGDGNDIIYGGAGNDTITGGLGIDTIYADRGNNSVDGGDGDDNIYVDVSAGGSFQVNGGSGNDRLGISVGAGSTAGVTSFSLPAMLAAGSSLVGIETLTISSSISSANFNAFSINASSLNDTIYTGYGNDVLYGLDGADFIDASQGDDQIFGGAGNDSLYGRQGSDSISGGDDADYIYDAEGNNTLSGDGGNDTLSAGGGNDTLNGGDGNDQLYGAGGADVIDGGAGDDVVTYAVSAPFVAARVTGGLGTDAISLSVNGPVTLTVTTSELAARGFENITINGSVGDDVITADGAHAYLYVATGDGHDRIYGGQTGGSLFGGAGNDILHGGSGKHFLYGGTGADLFVFASFADSNSSVVDQIEDFETGVDQIDLSRMAPTNVNIVTYSFGSYISANTLLGLFYLFVRQTVVLADLILVSSVISGTAGGDTLNGTAGADTIEGLGGNDILRGQAGNDTLDGGAGNDLLYGNAGNDSMRGGAGDDIYYVTDSGDSVSEAGGSGIDEVRSTVAFTLADGVERLRLQGGATSGTGNAGDNVLIAGAGATMLSGLGGNDTLTGGGNVDTLSGGDGDDVIYGRNGNDTLNGGAGNDTLRGEIGSDVINGDGGNDSIYGGDGIETAHGGDGDDVIRGEGQGDLLYGDAGSDTLQGGDGNDTLTGGAGRDTLNGGLGNDRYVFLDGDFAGLTNTTADRIQDFAQGSDLIRLREVDANSALANDQNFTFIGTAAFGNIAGQLRYAQAAGVTLLLGDTNGDGAADFAIALTGTINLTAADFIL